MPVSQKMKLISLLAAAGLLVPAPSGAQSIASRIYPAPTAPLASIPLTKPARLIAVTTRDGLKLNGIVHEGGAQRPLLLVLHGNASSAAGALEWLRPLAAAGYGIVAAEYRGYSGNPGRPGEAGLVEDARAFLAEARRIAGTRPVWVVGHSLGGAVGLSLSRSEKFDALITIGTFTRLREMAPALARALVPNEYDNGRSVSQLDEPWYLVHGTADEVVPWKQGEALHKLARTKSGASFVVLGATHRPDAGQLLAILESVASHRRSGKLAADGLPKMVKLIPFGSGGPLNP